MITVEIVLPNGSSITSLPLATTREEFLEDLNEIDFADFPAFDAEGKEVVFCVSTSRIFRDCVLIFREVE